MLRSMTGIVDMGRKAARLKWDCVGHVSWMLPEKWANVPTLGCPRTEGADGTGREGAWRDDLDGLEKKWWEVSKWDQWKIL